MRYASLCSVLLACAVYASYGLECEQNQNGQSMSFFKTSGDLSLIGFFDVYDEKCSGPTPTGVHSMEMVATVIQILNSIHYVPGVTLGLTLYEVCTYRDSDLQKALISFAVDQDCNNTTTPIAVYTTAEVRAKIADSPSVGLPDVPIAAAGPIVDVDAHAESAVAFLTANDVFVADLLVARDGYVARRFANAADVGGLCVNSTVLARDFGRLNDSFVVVVMADNNHIKSILESSSNVRVSHFVIIPLDGPLPPPKPDFRNGSFVFQAYGSCPFANKSAADDDDDDESPGAGQTAEQAVSTQFVQTAADVLRIVDAYDGGETDGCGRNVTGECEPASAKNNRSETAAEAVGYGAEAIGRVLDRLMLLDGGDYNVTLVHVTEYGGGGRTVAAYAQDSNGTRQLRLLTARPHMDGCGATSPCPACRPPPRSSRHDDDDDGGDGGGDGPACLTWKEDVWIASALTVCAVGAACAACVAAFVLVRVCKKDVMEGNPTFTLLLIAGTLAVYASAVPFAVEEDGCRPDAVCYAKLFGACASCALVFATMLSRSVMIAACDCDSSFMSHVNGYVQTCLFVSAVSVQLALMAQFAAVHAAVPSSDLCRLFVRDSRLFLGSVSYDALLLALLCAASPFVARSKRNYREGACFAAAAYLALAVWLCWCAAYALLPRERSDVCVMVGLTGTATAIVVTVLVPRTYMMTFGIVREQITSSLPSLGYGRHGDIADVNYRSTQALYDSVHVVGAAVAASAAAPKCQSSSFKGQSNPNYYSPACSQVHSVPRSRPLTPVNEYDVPPSPEDNRITRF